MIKQSQLTNFVALMHNDPNNWFENWFDTSYYHTLYNKRNDLEASQFLEFLIDFLNPKLSAAYLDLACGKGRHSIYLNKKGFNVTGVDLSANSIQFAQKYSTPSLKFEIHDMRQLFKAHAFDYVLSLFTSFGYFSDPNEDKLVIKNVKENLKPDGIFVLDYFNAAKPNLNFNHPFTKSIAGVQFDIFKRIEGDRIIKEIQVTDNQTVYKYSEQVRIYTRERLTQIIEEVGLKVVNVFGSYALEPYDELTCDRLIIIAKN